MIECLYCKKAHEDADRLCHSETSMYRVMDATGGDGQRSKEKEYYCNPACYLSNRSGRSSLRWVDVESWCLERPEIWSPDRIRCQFDMYKKILHLSSGLTMDDARKGVLRYNNEHELFGKGDTEEDVRGVQKFVVVR